MWRHGDWAELTAHGGLVIYGRSDATLNPGGVRIGTAEIYRQVEQLPEVVESLVIGQEVLSTDGLDVRIVLFVRLRAGVALDDALRDRIQRAHPRERHAASRAEADRPGGGHPAHDQREDHRARRARRRARPAGEERGRAGEPGGARRSIGISPSWPRDTSGRGRCTAQ